MRAKHDRLTRADRAPDADGRRPDARRDRPRGRRLPRSRARRASTSPSTTSASRPTPARSSSRRSSPRSSAASRSGSSTTSTTPGRSRCRRRPRRSRRRSRRCPCRRAAIAGIPDLMHHKYVVRDGTDVWSGSTNWTDDSWSRQENVIVRVLGAPALARAFTLNLDELWERGTVEHTGRVEPRPVDVDGGIEVRPWFTPEYGDALSHRVAKFLGRARQPDPDRLARADLGPDPRHARRGRERAPLRRRRRDRRDAGRRGLPPVGDERRQRVEDPAAAHGARRGRRSRASRRRGGRRSRCTTSCTRRSSSPTTSPSSARSTSRARASGTPRTCSRSTTAAIADRLATFVDDGARPLSARRRRPRTRVERTARRCRDRER